MGRNSSKAVRNNNKPQRQLNKELKAKQSDKPEKDPRNSFAGRMKKQLDAARK